MADAQSDAEKIRQKRLAKLGGGQQPKQGEESASPKPRAATPSVPSAPVSQDVPASPTSAPEPSIAAQPPKPTESPNPFSKLGIEAESKPAPRITITPKSSVPQKREVEDSSRSQPRQAESVDVWTNRTLSNIFRVTLDPNQLRDSYGNALYFLESLRSELEEQGTEAKLSTEMLDQVILATTGNGTYGEPLDYLLGCWKRVSRMFRGMRSGEHNERYNAVQEARRICMNYCIYAVTMPELFDREAQPDHPLAKYLLEDPESDRGICHDFLAEAVSRFDGEDGDSVKEMLVGAMEQLSSQLAKMSMNDNYKPYVLALRNFSRYPPLVQALVEAPSFLPENVEAQDIENTTLLGPFFTLSPMQGEVAINYFSSPKTRDRRYIANAQKSLRMTLSTHQDELYDIANHFIRAREASREKMLDWFALTVNTNHKRRATQVDPKTVSSDGFMVNVTVVLDRLCEPFMDARFSKIDRIDINYLRRHPRVTIKDETKFNAEQKTSDEFYAHEVEGSNNFISEVFFLTVAAHHYGTEAANTNLTSLQRDVQWLEKQLEKLELERHKFASDRFRLQIFENHVKRQREIVEKGQCKILATQGVLLDEISQARSMQFMRYVIVWMIRIASPGIDYPHQPMQLPLPEEQSLTFRCLPEYFLEDVVDNFKFITRNLPRIITSTQCEELVAVCITFLRSSEYIKNPYLKAGLVTILFHGVWPVYGRSKGVLGDLLYGSDFAAKHLLHALMKFYIEAESTGGHTQFYDKFNIRYEIFQVIRCIWPNTVYRENLGEEARVNLDFFVRFVNLLLNDVTFVLDESFSSFAKIHELTLELRSPESMAQAVRQEKEEALAAAQSKAKSYMSLTKETVAMLKLFTEALAESFTVPEIVQRLADMLDYNLDALVGPKQSNLKLENPQEYGWSPHQMLSDIIDVYLNLKDQQRFRTAVARDGRSYKPENFTTATRIAQRHALKSPEQMAAWEHLAAQIALAKAEDEEEEEDYGDVPDEFLDPLVYTIMEDPVTLPTSRVTIDRSTIRSHLLSDPNDPFNRMPLKIEDVVPNTELKEKILAYKQERKAERMKRLAKARENVEAGPSTSAGDVMDTS